MSQQYIDLCAHVVEENCGYSAAEIFSVIAQYGGLTSSAISHHTGIARRRLHTILLIMLKQRVLLHRLDSMDNTVYYADPDSAYECLRAHRLGALASDRHGEAAAELVSHIHFLGQASVGELVNSLCSDAKQTTDGEASCNGTSKEPKDVQDGEEDIGEDDGFTKPTFTTAAELHSLLRSLLRDGLLAKVGARSFTPTTDLKDELMKLILDDMPDHKVKAKQQGEFEEAVKDLKRRWLEEDEYTDLRDLDSARSTKRVKLNGGLENGVSSQTANSGPFLPVNMVVRASFARCTQDLSQAYLKRLADRYLGETTAAVYDALLHAIHSKKRIQHRSTLADAAYALGSRASPTASVAEVSAQLDPSLDLTFPIAGVSHVSKLNGDGKPVKKQKISDGEDFTEIGIKAEAKLDSEAEEDGSNAVTAYQERNKKLLLIEEHLRLLEEHPKGFCKRIVGGGRGEWGIDPDALDDTVARMEIDNIILSRFGKVSMRLVRLLREKGKLDDKQVAALGIMRTKDARLELTKLKYEGYVDATEVPKDNSRQASRSIFLWNHQEQAVRDLVLQHCFGSMRRILQRLEEERFKYRAIREKAELMHDRQDALSKNDRDMIMKAREVEGKLLTQMQRIDELVAILTRPKSG